MPTVFENQARAGKAFVPGNKSSCLHVLKSIKLHQPQVQKPTSPETIGSHPTLDRVLQSPLIRAQASWGTTSKLLPYNVNILL